MANYPNPTTRRLAITIASYIDEFGSWPTEARLSAEALYWVAYGLDIEHFTRLTARLKVSVTRHAYIAVGGNAGHLVYLQTNAPRAETVAEVERELDIDPQRSVVDDPPSAILVALADQFRDSEALHRIVLRELLPWTGLAQGLGIWSNINPPVVVELPAGGPFELALAPHGGAATVHIAVRVGGRLEPSDFARLAAAAGTTRAVLIAIDAPVEGEVNSVTLVTKSQLALAVQAEAGGRTGSAGELARVYGALLVAPAGGSSPNEAGTEHLST